jgi:hypothetical protein
MYIVFVILALIFCFTIFPRGILRQTIIADYVASALVEFDSLGPLPTVLDLGNVISFEAVNAAPPRPVPAYFGAESLPYPKASTIASPKMNFTLPGY